MHVLFVHQCFPGQFGQMATELTLRHGFECSFIVEEMGACPSPTQQMLDTVTVRKLERIPDYEAGAAIGFPQAFRWNLENGCEAIRIVKSLPDYKPDIIINHSGRGAFGLTLPEVLDCPLVNYCEYYYRPPRDMNYRVDLPHHDGAWLMPRHINDVTLLSMVSGYAGISPTEWQRQSFPKRFHQQIEVRPDGMDLSFFKKRDVARQIGPHIVNEDTKIVTFVTRGMESMRGFDRFLRLADRLQREIPNIVFAVAGIDGVAYGMDGAKTGMSSFRDWAMQQYPMDMSRIYFLGHIDIDELVNLFSITDLHVYLTVPFVVSWSLLNAMACEALVLGSDVGPVREFIEPGKTGLVENFFDVEAQTRAALAALRNPSDYTAIRKQARGRIEETWEMGMAVDGMKDYCERIVNRYNSKTPEPALQETKPAAAPRKTKGTRR